MRDLLNLHRTSLLQTEIYAFTNTKSNTNGDFLVSIRRFIGPSVADYSEHVTFGDRRCFF